MNLMRELLSTKLVEDDYNPDAVQPADETSSDKPEETEKVIAKADEFRVVLNTETEQVDILDGEQSVRLSMPLVIWKQLTRQ